jgi:hypothetical protein
VSSRVQQEQLWPGRVHSLRGRNRSLTARLYIMFKQFNRLGFRFKFIRLRFK